MQIFDLSHPFEHNMPVYPGDIPVKLRQTVFINDHGYNNHYLETGMHVGTHMDAPLHMLENGCMISELGVNQFVGRGILINAVDMDQDRILHTIEENVSKGDIVLFRFDYSKHFGSPDYYYKYPEISETVAEKLVSLEVKMIGMDTPSPDRNPFQVHKILLAKNIPIVENLCNLDKLEKCNEFRVIALPLRIHADGSPTRVIALVELEQKAMANL
jgi:kynurenine formamidase